MPWVVVKFIDTNEVEAVPTCWLVGEKKDVVVWPQNFSKIQMQQALKKEICPEEHWEEYNVKKLGPREYDTFATACAKATKGCVTSEVESVLPEKRIRTKKTYSSSENEISSEDLSPPVAFQTGSKSYKQVEKNAKARKALQPFKKTQAKCVNSPENLGYDDVETATEPEVMRSNAGLAALEVFTAAAPEEFQKKCLQLLVKNKKLITDCDENVSELSRKVDELKEMLSVLMGNREQDTASDKTLTDIFINEFPVKSFEELEAIEKKLQRDDVANYITDSLYRIGGRDYKDCIRRFLKKMMADSVAAHYSLQGHKKKKIFSSTKMFAVITGAVLKCDKNVQLKNIEIIVSQWLAKAPERLKKIETQTDDPDD
ncbi:unnamed protein product [Brassicogethes aeneus]|uniref:DUF4806 domain-containing protein n=1 Tax=Brassicogethes aeneus TaxID=1431903 RepID=A0A9P0BHA3_BRAAE|nr:unnamed protein product [Brassicogethes aeneus]